PLRTLFPLTRRHPPTSTLFPFTTLFRSYLRHLPHTGVFARMNITTVEMREIRLRLVHFFDTSFGRTIERRILLVRVIADDGAEGDRKSTRLNSSHVAISYAVFCLKNKKK